MQADTGAHRVFVWDWPTRLFHWLLVLGVAGSFATHYAGIEWFAWHRRLGYMTLVLVLFRVTWGFLGPCHARFASFVRSPAAILEQVRHAAHAASTAGHNPLGALNVLAFLAVLLLQAATGLFANDEIASAGPFLGWVSQQTSNRLTYWHDINSKLLIALITLHLAAVTWYDLRHRAGLTTAMWTGYKRLPLAVADIDSSRTLRAVVIVVALGVALAVAIRAAPESTISLF